MQREQSGDCAVRYTVSCDMMYCDVAYIVSCDMM